MATLYLMQPSIVLPPSQGDCTMAHIHIGIHHGPWSFQQGCDSGSQFPAVFVHEVILPQVQSFAILLIELQKIPVGLVHKFLKTALN